MEDLNLRIGENCDVCGRPDKLKVTGSALGSASIARCKICWNKGAEPFGLAAVFFGRYGDFEVSEIKNRLTWKEAGYLSVFDASKKYPEEFSELYEGFLEIIRNP